MTGSIIVINVDIRETRVALVEEGVIAELQIERASHRGTVGNVVLGKVTRVLPGMQAAFIDVGQERSAFLHVEDLIRPDDFELYLAGDAGEQNESFRGTGERKATQLREDEDDDADDEESGGAVSQALNGRSGGGALSGAEELEPAVASAALGRQQDADDETGDDALDVDGSEDDIVSEDEAAEAGALEDDESEADDGDELDEVEDIDADELDDEDADESSDEDDDDDDVPLAARRSHTLDEGVPSDVPVSGREPGGDSLGPPSAGSTSGAAVPDVLDSDVLASPAALGGSRAPRARGDRPAAGRSGAVGPNAGRTEALRSGTGRADVAGARSDAARGSDSTREGGNQELGRGRGGNRQRGRGGQQGSRGRRGRQRPNGNDNSGANASANSNSKLVRGRRAVRGKVGGGNGGRHSDAAAPTRVTRSVPITDVVSEGDMVVVQISKEPIGTKGARVTSHVSLPGRYVVYLPTVDHLGISKRIGSARERQRLRQVMESLKPARGGLIVRTVAEGLTKKQLKADVGYLIRVWAEVCKRRETAKPAEELYTELDLVLKVARDLFTDEVKSIVIDDRDQYARLVRFVEMFLPERVKDIELYTGSEPIFDAYGIEDEIGRALSRKVPLPSGGSLIVDQAEALTAIDVNTGRYVGKGSKDLEETALKTNLEAVEEIAYQLRFRNIGGLVILDLIDMEKYQNREKVWRALETALVKDKAKTTLNRISELGLIEMTRKRTRESLGRMLHEPCFYCDGTGQIQSKATIAYEILRQIGRERYSLPGYSVVVNAHPAIVDFLKTVDRSALDEAERRYARRIELAPRTEYHIEQYDMQGK